MDLLRGHLANVSFDEEVKVGDDDEGRREARARVVVRNHFKALELPVFITPLLDLSEGVAGQRDENQRRGEGQEERKRKNGKR